MDQHQLQQFRKHCIRSCHINAFICAMLFFLQLSVPPFLSKEFGMDAMQFGYFQTLGAAVMFIGSPIFGRFADNFGARYAVIAANVSSLSYYLTLAFATNIYMFFFSQVTLCFAHSLPAFQMIVSDVSETKDRPDALGKVGMCFGFGMLAGSIIGGWLQASYGERATVLASAIGSMINLMITAIFIPKNTKMFTDNSKTDLHKDDEKGSSTKASATYRLLKSPHVLFLLILKFISFLPAGLIQSIISIILIDHFHLDAQANGLMLAYFGILTIVVQGFFVGYLTKQYSQYTVLRYASISLIFTNFFMAQTTNLIPYCIVILCFAVGSDTSQVVLSSFLTSLAPESDSGSMIGIITTVEFGIRLLSPSIASYFFSVYGITALGWIGLSCTLLSVLMLILHSEIDIKKD